MRLLLAMSEASTATQAEEVAGRGQDDLDSMLSGRRVRVCMA